MNYPAFPVIDPVATGKNILSLRKERGLSVRDLQEYFGFEEPQAIYRWQYGKTLPSVDNLYALSAVLGVPMERILVPVTHNQVCHMKKQQEDPAAFVFYAICFRSCVSASMKKFWSTKLISFSVVGFPITSMRSAVLRLSHSVTFWAESNISR